MAAPDKRGGNHASFVANTLPRMGDTTLVGSVIERELHVIHRFDGLAEAKSDVTPSLIDGTHCGIRDGVGSMHVTLV